MSVLSSTVFAPLPPSYSQPLDDFDADSFPASLHDNLPAYTPPIRLGTAQRQPVPPKEFYYELKRRGKVFASLTLAAEGSCSKHVPTFVEGRPIKGRVKLNFDKPDALQAVVVSMRGQVITGPNLGEQMTFLNISRNLWSQADGEPFLVRSDHSESNPGPQHTPSSKFNGKLQGDYVWPFSIDLPKEVVLSGRTFILPQTFSERHTRASINYEICLQLARGKLRTDHRPVIICNPAQYLINIGAHYQDRGAVREGASLLGPTIDPDGWFSPEPVLYRGRVFKNRVAEVRSTLFLAKPLLYTKGSVIPLALRLESIDEQALDLLSSPKSIVLRLERRIKYFANWENTLEAMAWKDSIAHSQPAVWWPSTEGSERSGQHRFVNGELHLKADIKPTSAMAQFRIEYSVILFPFDAPGLASLDSKPLLQFPVEIVTSYAPGPRPRMTAPPGYDSEAPALIPTNTISTAGIEFL